MNFIETPLAGAYVIEPKRFEDNRGFLAIAFNSQDFADRGLCDKFVQTNISYNKSRGTLRGLHSQRAPYQEVKLIRCVRGAAWDVIVDIRPNSETFGQWYGTEVTAENRRMVYIPKGFLHGFITLENDTELLYQVSDYYHPELECSARYDDEAFNIQWPTTPLVLSQKDESWPAFQRLAETAP